MKKILFLLILSILVLSACSNDESLDVPPSPPPMDSQVNQQTTNSQVAEDTISETSSESSQDISEDNSNQNMPEIIEEEIQETVTLSFEPENSCINSLAHDYREYRDIAQKNIKFTRPHPGPFNWETIDDYSESDKWVEAAQAQGIAIVGTIFPYDEDDQTSCHSDECKVGSQDMFYSRTFTKGHSIPNYRCAPCNTENYKQFVSDLVERYDGDGVDDMPGLEIPIKHWEISNEPELDFSDLTFFIGTKEEFVEMTKNGYEAVKAACPDCQVLHGGAAGSDGTLRYWEDLFNLGIGDYFDIANIHFIGMWDKNTLNVKDYKALLDRKGLDKEIWVTEAELMQNDNVQQILTNTLNAGASKIFLVFYDVLNFDASSLC